MTEIFTGEAAQHIAKRAFDCYMAKWNRDRLSNKGGTTFNFYEEARASAIFVNSVYHLLGVKSLYINSSVSPLTTGTSRICYELKIPLDSEVSKEIKKLLLASDPRFHE